MKPRNPVHVAFDEATVRAITRIAARDCRAVPARMLMGCDHVRRLPWLLAERTLDRSLQRLRRRGVIRFKPGAGAGWVIA